MSNTKPENTITLYDAALGGTPDTQGKLAYRDSRAAAATQSFADGVTTLDTMANQADAAGYFADPRAIPALDRSAGYALRFSVQLVSEYHADSDKNGDQYSNSDKNRDKYTHGLPYRWLFNTDLHTITNKETNGNTIANKHPNEHTIKYKYGNQYTNKHSGPTHQHTDQDQHADRPNEYANPDTHARIIHDQDSDQAR